MDILKEIKSRVLLFDGGTGSLLQEAGLLPGELPETWNIKRPEVVKGLHKAYLQAGADLIKTNTFGANRLKYNASSEYDLPEIMEAALWAAKSAVREAGHGLIALDLGPTGRLLRPMGSLDFEDAVSLYREVVQLGVKEGADLILIETMSDMYELKAAVLAAKENSSLPVFATCVFDAGRKMLTGGSPASVVALLEGLRVDALGTNCSLGPVQMKGAVEELLRYASVPVIVNPNAGLPRSEGGKTVYDIGPEEFADACGDLLDLGVSVVGGCCGTTPEHIRLLKRKLEGRKAPEITEKTETLVSSYAAVQVIGQDPVIVGERINPTGKKKMAQALRDGDLGYILQMGLEQQEKGAHILDVNVGLPGLDEGRSLTQVMEELQAVCELPLQIDSSSPDAMEKALRRYNGKAMVNSVNGTKESMDRILPLVRKYGGVLVALTLDEGGIPKTAEGRVEIARKILREVEKAGIPKKDLLIDCLCLTISSEPDGALVTLEAMRRVREELGLGSILGVSNISFGLPHREIVNQAFFTMALQNHLSAGIINPGSDGMMRAYHAYRALANLDASSKDFISAYGMNYREPLPKGAIWESEVELMRSRSEEAGGAVPSLESQGGQDPSKADRSKEGSLSPASDSLEGRLILAVERGLKGEAERLTRDLLKRLEALQIINACMIPALDRVGRAFEEGTLFLPQLLMSAEAAKSAFAVLKERFDELGESQEKKGTVLLATVKGDIHDIGKNIVRVLLESYSFEVVDLGKDVPPEKILEVVKERQIRLVGLSALMTTTVSSMEETIRLLRKEAPGVKVMVGGAVMTRSYASSIGADMYCRDAMASVNYAGSVLEKKAEGS